MASMRISGRVRRLAVGPAALLAAVAIGTVPAQAHGDHSRLQAVLRYTEYGIPHIIATSHAGLGYGYGYAVAKDNICVLAETYLTVDGGRSRFFGAAAPANPDLGSASSSLNSDLYFARVKAAGVVERLMSQPPPLGPEPEVQELVRGYVAGYNRYLRDTGTAGIADPACHDAPWVRPITELDVYRHLYAVLTISGAGAVMDGIVNAQPPTPAPAPASTSAMSSEQTAGLVAAWRDAGGGSDLGSNAIAVGSAGTTSGRSVLLANPHFPWRGPRRMWQSQLTIPGRLNVSGAGLLGFPAVMIGHNADVAWSHTISTASTFGLFEVPVVASAPTTYLVDGTPEPMTSDLVRVEVRNPDGSTGTVERRLWSTRYGPVIVSGPGVPLPWRGTAFSLRDGNATNLRALNSWLGLGRTRTTDDVLATLSRTQGLPWINTIAADRRGTVLFADIQVVAHVTNELANACSTALGRIVFPVSGISILDGGRSACAWGSDPDAVEPGLLGPARLPRLSRTDFVTNSNNSPWLTNPQSPLTDYPRVVGDVGTARTPRTQEGILAVQRRLAGSDGQLGQGFSRETMRQMLYADHSRVAELAAADTAAMCASFPGGVAPSASGPVDVAAGCVALAAWDHSYQVGSRGSLLFARFVGRLGGVPGGPWQHPFDVQDPLNTPNTLATQRPELQRAFGDAAAELRAAGIPLDAPLGEHQHVTRDGERLAIHGAPNALGVLNVITAVWDPPGGGNTEVIHGSSFIQVVEFDAAGPKGSTVLTYSQASDPTSPHHADQTRVFSASQWVRDRFTELEILSSPQLRIAILIE